MFGEFIEVNILNLLLKLFLTDLKFEKILSKDFHITGDNYKTISF